MRQTFIVLLLVVIVFLSSIVAIIAYYNGFRLFPSTLQISHSPPASLLIGNAVTFTANVTGLTPQNVILTYRILQRAQGSQGFILSDPVQTGMFLSSGNTYSSTISGSQLFGAYLSYQISASDPSGNTVHTATYDVPIADFDWHLLQTNEVTVIRGISAQVVLPQLDAFNGFNQSVTIKVAGSLPGGVNIAAPAAQVTVPALPTIQISSTSDSQLVQRYPVEIDATYVPSGATSVQVTRTISLILTVTDFTVAVTPPYVTLLTPTSTTPTQAMYAVTLETYAGFTAPNGLDITVTGLPAKTTWQLTLAKSSIDQTNNAVTTYNLIITGQYGITVGMYLLDFNVAASTPAGTVIHDVPNIELEVSSS